MDGRSSREVTADDEVRAWLELEPDAANRAELEQLLADDDRVGLADLFDHQLRFGTAGLRGALGPGPNRMNLVTVARVALALARWAPGATVVIGYDARHGSREFAAVTATIVAGAGGTPVLFDDLVPTPVLAFAVREAGADIGVMVTASHNPPGDNGYKVYRRDGAQLIPPADREIEAEIAAIDLEDVGEALSIHRAGPAVETASAAEMVDRYLDAVIPDVEVGHPTVAYTPLHGVGRAVFARALSRLHVRMHAVPTQAEPDPDFPTVAFPNPEEPGALDELIALAKTVDADVALAHDPDADRLAVVLPLRPGWEALSGNELGALLADHRLATTTGPNRLVVTTVVSSRLLGRLAEDHGVGFAETLTGFKWVMRPAIDTDAHFVFGYEEALGYAVNDVVRDKDGLSAGVAFLHTLARLSAMGLTPRGRLDELARRHGLHVSGQRTIAFAGAEAQADMAGVMDRARRDGWSALAGSPVIDTVDFADGSFQPGTDLLRFDLQDRSRVQIRPSGTEPKLKIYCEVIVDLGEADDPNEKRADGRRWCDELLVAAAGALE